MSSLVSPPKKLLNALDQREGSVMSKSMVSFFLFYIQFRD